MAARALAEPPPSPPAPAPAPQRQKRKRKYEPVQSVDDPPIEGQCQGITKEGKRCCVHRLNEWACAKPLQAGGRFCSLHDPASTTFTGTQCAAIKKGGERCRIFSGATHSDAWPLRCGHRFCTHHELWPSWGLPTVANCSDGGDGGSGGVSDGGGFSGDGSFYDFLDIGMKKPCFEGSSGFFDAQV